MPPAAAHKAVLVRTCSEKPWGEAMHYAIENGGRVQCGERSDAAVTMLRELVEATDDSSPLRQGDNAHWSHVNRSPCPSISRQRAGTRSDLRVGRYCGRLRADHAIRRNGCRRALLSVPARIHRKESLVSATSAHECQPRGESSGGRAGAGPTIGACKFHGTLWLVARRSDAVRRAQRGEVHILSVERTATTWPLACSSHPIAGLHGA